MAVQLPVLARSPVAGNSPSSRKGRRRSTSYGLFPSDQRGVTLKELLQLRDAHEEISEASILFLPWTRLCSIPLNVKGGSFCCENVEWYLGLMWKVEIGLLNISWYLNAFARCDGIVTTRPNWAAPLNPRDFAVLAFARTLCKKGRGGEWICTKSWTR